MSTTRRIRRALDFAGLRDCGNQSEQTTELEVPPGSEPRRYPVFGFEADIGRCAERNPAYRGRLHGKKGTEDRRCVLAAVVSMLACEGVYLASKSTYAPSWLSVIPSYSRPRLSEGNSYAEALVEAAKYRAEFLAKGAVGAVDFNAARVGTVGSVFSYNDDHCPKGHLLGSPCISTRHRDGAIPMARHQLYSGACALNQLRHSRCAREWSAVGVVTYYRERHSVIMPNYTAVGKRSLFARGRAPLVGRALGSVRMLPRTLRQSAE